MTPIEILNKHHLKRTACREGIIGTMIKATYALSEAEIREELPGNYDRTTFYRSFKTLEENNIIHKIIIDNQQVKYAIDNTPTAGKSHAHFYCNECKSVRCMDNILIEKPVLPNGFVESETEVMIKGICASCKKNKID